MTHPKAYAPRWSVCYLDRVGLPLAKAHRYAGLLGVPQLDPRGMLELFLDQPAAHCLRSLALDLDDVEGWLPEILQTIAEFRAPIETITIVSRGPGVEGVLRTWTEAAALPYLHTLIVNRVVLHLPGGDPDVEWTGDAASIRALGRAATGADLTASERALDRIRRMNRNSDRYFEAVCAGEPVDTRTIRSFGRDAMLDYTAEASSFVRQREQYEIDGINPRWSLRALWRELMPKHAWVNSLEAFAARVTAHNRTHDSAELRALPIAAMRDDPAWIAFRAEAGRLREHFLDSQG